MRRSTVDGYLSKPASTGDSVFDTVLCNLRSNRLFYCSIQLCRRFLEPLDAEIPARLEIPNELLESLLSSDRTVTDRTETIEKCIGLDDGLLQSKKSSGETRISKPWNDIWDNTLAHAIEEYESCTAVEPFLDRLFSCWGRTGLVLVKIAKLMAPLLWRTRISDVSDELKLPPIVVTTTFIQFSSLERYFYQVS